jgi:iron complex transport system substrate-binding protein
MAAWPDLVLIRPMIDRGYPQLVQRLEKSAIKVVSLQPGTIDEMFVYWEILGILTGKQDRAQQMIAQFKHKVSEIASLTAPIFAKKKVYFEAIHKQMKTFAPDAMAMFALKTAGGVNIAQDAQQVRNTNIAFYGKERILSHADEIDVFIAQQGAMNWPTVSLIKEESGFSAIKAIKNNQILIIDEMIVSRPTMRLIDGIMEIGMYLYPTIFNPKPAKPEPD